MMLLMKEEVQVGLKMHPDILAELDATRLSRKPKVSRKAAIEMAVTDWVKREKRK